MKPETEGTVTKKELKVNSFLIFLLKMSGMRMKKRPTMDYQEIVSDPESPFKVTLVNDDINHWEVKFIGPSDTYYEGLLFRLSVVFPVR